MHPIEPVGPDAAQGAPFVPPAPGTSTGPADRPQEAPFLPPAPGSAAPFGATGPAAPPWNAPSANPAGNPGQPICGSCGSSPVRNVTFVEGHGMIMVRHQKRTSGVLCRSCALSIGRRMQAATAVLGWWGFISFFVNWVALWTNGKELSNAAELAPPQPTAWSNGRVPLDPGQPVTRRPQMLVPVAVALVSLYVLVHIFTG